MIIIVIIKIMIMMIIIQCKEHVSPPGCSHAQEDRTFEGSVYRPEPRQRRAADMLMCLQEEILITLFYLPGLWEIRRGGNSSRRRDGDEAKAFSTSLSWRCSRLIYPNRISSQIKVRTSFCTESDVCRLNKENTAPNHLVNPRLSSNPFWQRQTTPNRPVASLILN